MHFCEIEKKLERLGLRKTKDRHAILELFRQDRTWTAAQIEAEMNGADLSTVYRNLQKLVQKEVLTEVHSHDGEAHYERAREDHHDHLACDSCRVVECVPCPIEQIQTHHLELSGQCSSCE